jgi:6-phosphogluconolactonase (cycloisomerase 2 family)
VKSQLRKHLWFSRMVFSLSLGLLFLPTGCVNSSTPVTPAPSTPAALLPTITAISPASALAGSATDFTLTVNGTDFVAASAINFGGTTPTTTFVSSTQLTAAIPAAAIASAGTIAVTVTNPAPGRSTSNMVSFAINIGTNPIPTISSLDPGCAPGGAQTSSLAVNGTNFAPGSVIRWNGTNLPTTLLDVNDLFANIPASDLATAGTATVTVFNPAPGGGVSNSLSFNVASGGVGPVSLAVDPTGKFAYVANNGCPDAFYGSVSMYTINPTDGTLTSAGPPVTTGDYDADSLAVDPSGKFAYVANWGGGNTGGSVSMYAIDGTTGILTPTGTIQAPCTSGPGSCAPLSLAVHPSGKFVYVANEGGFAPTSVSMYAIDATTGVLGLIGIVAADGRAASVTEDPSGKFAYVVAGVENANGSEAKNLSLYSINATTGVLTSTGQIVTSASPSWIAFAPSGKFAYLNGDSNSISTYTLNLTTGNLVSTGAPDVQAGGIAFAPSGKFVYVTRSGGVSLYTMDITTGALTFVGITAPGSTPDGITFHPSGKFAYGTNYSSNSVSIYAVDTSAGSLTLIGTIGT